MRFDIALLRFRSQAKLCLKALSAALLASSALCVPVFAQSPTVPGQFGVGASGAATYSIPISSPPGTAGVVPSLSLSYNSQGGNGLVGVGWSIDGLPTIGRCRQTMTQDGARGAVRYDVNDRFCMDGQRLVLVSGTYGADGAEYRTEIETFSKIISHGTAGTGPAWFEVRTKGGQIMEFGNTTDSRVLAQGKTTARDWGVNKVSDTKGNYFTVTYTNDTTNGQVYPSRIDYTGNATTGLAPYNSVQFVYGTRPDAMIAYHAGSLMKTTVLLTNVRTYSGSSLVADYQLTYADSTSSARRLLSSIKLCDGAANCLPATTFAWTQQSISMSVLGDANGLAGTQAGSRMYIGDFNGDGRADIFWDSGAASSAASTGTRSLWTSSESGGFTVTSNVAGKNGQLSGYYLSIGDVNRDGRADLWWYNPAANSPTYRWYATGGGNFTVSAPGDLTPLGYYLVAIDDINGDGRADPIWYYYTSQVNIVNYWVTQPDGSAVSTTLTICNSYPYTNCFNTVAYADFTGDGLADVVYGFPQFGLGIGKGDGTFQSQINLAYPAITTPKPYYIDINGDGKVDVLWDATDSNGRSLGQRVLWISRGDGTFAITTNVNGKDGTLAGYRPYFADMNGDGIVDIVWNQETGGAPTAANRASSPINQAGLWNQNNQIPGLSTGLRCLWLGNGDGTFRENCAWASGAGFAANSIPAFADFNGDGMTDIVWDSRANTTDTRSTGSRTFFMSTGTVPDLVQVITNGLGVATSITYRPLTDSSVYTKDGYSTDPVMDLQGPFYVVSRVDSDNGLGGTVGTTYAYAGAKANQEGRGFLGFRQRSVTDLSTNTVQTTTYRQDYPYTALVSRETKAVAGVTLASTTNSYDAAPLGGTRYQVSLSQSQVGASDLDGTALPTATNTFQYDAYGNATQIVASATDGFSKTTTNTYTNDTTRWYLGRLTRASVTSASTGTTTTAPSVQPVSVVISTSQNNVNLWSYLVANGVATTGAAGSWTVTIGPNVTIGSASTSTPAFDTGVFPTGSTLKIINNGTIAGAGGGGGAASDCSGSINAPGKAGGVALRAQYALGITNAGKVWGGGGGGGGVYAALPYGSGGGGAGAVAGSGVPSFGFATPGGTYNVAASSSGTLTNGGAATPATSNPDGGNYPTGGNGGNSGTAGAPGGWACQDGGVFNPAPGGAAGAAASGNSFITWLSVGDRRGPLN